MRERDDTHTHSRTNDFIIRLFILHTLRSVWQSL